MTIKLLNEIDCENKRVLIREDFNVPIKNGEITDDSRLRATLPTIKYVLDNNAQVILVSHLGRPQAGIIDDDFSLAPVADALQNLLGQPVSFMRDWIDGVTAKPGTITLCENVRFLKGEKENDPVLAKKMAALCDIFVMDAFATAHRAHASTTGIAEFADIACAGPLLMQEIQALEKVMDDPKHPIIAIVGGAKISTKLSLLSTLLQKVDHLIVGGGIANTLLAASDKQLGDSLLESELIDTAKAIIKQARPEQLPLPTDVIVAKTCDATAKAENKNTNDISHDDKVLDIGHETQQHYAQLIRQAKTIIWNGPVGVFEYQPFAAGTETIAKAIAESDAYSLAGGGDTIAAINQFNIKEKISYISTGGGAFLSFLQGDTLPALAILQKRG